MALGSLGEQEIEGVDEATLKLALMRRYRNLAKLEERAAKFGSLHIPLDLENEIEAEKEKIAELEARLLEPKAEPTLVELLFSRGVQAQIQGELWEAKRYYEMVLREDEFYPQAAQLLAEVEQDLRPKTTSVEKPVGAGRDWPKRWAAVLVATLCGGLFFGGLLGREVLGPGGAAATATVQARLLREAYWLSPRSTAEMETVQAIIVEAVTAAAVRATAEAIAAVTPTDTVISTPTLAWTPMPTDTSTPTLTWTPTATPTPKPAKAVTPATLTATGTRVPPTYTPMPTYTSMSIPTVTNTPTQAVSATPELIGQFVLLRPSLEEPSRGRETEFEWRWTGPVASNQGFEIRVWHEGEPPLGVHDAVQDNRAGRVQLLVDDVYRLVVDIRNAPGVLGRSGEYLWTVLLVQIEPHYQELGIQATPQPFLFYVEGGTSGGEPPGDAAIR